MSSQRRKESVIDFTRKFDINQFSLLGCHIALSFYFSLSLLDISAFYWLKIIIFMDWCRAYAWLGGYCNVNKHTSYVNKHLSVCFCILVFAPSLLKNSQVNLICRIFSQLQLPEELRKKYFSFKSIFLIVILLWPLLLAELSCLVLPNKISEG